MADELKNEKDATLEDAAATPDGAEEDDATAELIEVLRQRSATYALLSRLYRREVDQPLLDELHGMLYPAETGDANMDQGYLYIATFLSNLWSGSVNELKVDYARCFLGNGVDGYSAAYPYESVYTSEKRLMMQAARDEVRAVYRAYGLEKTDDWKEGEDHVSLEMEFEQTMCDRTIEALEQGDEDKARSLISAQLGFLRDHLVAWTPMMTADMRVRAQTKLYQGLACLTDGYLPTDLQFLEDLLLQDD